jgi:hypothetical protein
MRLDRIGMRSGIRLRGRLCRRGSLACITRPLSFSLFGDARTNSRSQTPSHGQTRFSDAS